MARIKGRQLDIRGTIPTFLTDLKDGEIMVADDGDLYVRSGDKIWRFDSDQVAVSTTSTTTTTTTKTIVQHFASRGCLGSKRKCLGGTRAIRSSVFEI